MHQPHRVAALLIAISVLFTGVTSTHAADSSSVGPGVPPFIVRPGYRVTLAADHLTNARFITFGDDGTLYLSEPRAKHILALRDADKDGAYESRSEFVTDKASVHGMQWFDGALWFTTSDAIYTAKDTNQDGQADEIKKILGDLPHGGHWWRTILVDSSGFYTSIGDSGNITDQTNTDRQKIWHYNLDGSGKALFASGLRNTEKLMYRPGTTEVWGCDHGSDNFGAKYGEKPQQDQPITNLNPPDEFNHYVKGGFYGHPFITGLKMPRPEYADRKDIIELADKTIVPEWCFPAHWAPNGWTFLSKDYFTGHKGDAIVTFHGSWNRVPKGGYAVVMVMFDPVTQKPYGSQVLVSALTENGKVLERPVDAAEAPDGAVLFTGDHGNKIYRLSKLPEGK